MARNERGRGPGPGPVLFLAPRAAAYLLEFVLGKVLGRKEPEIRTCTYTRTSINIYRTYGARFTLSTSINNESI